jgi:hypothetical protein
MHNMSKFGTYRAPATTKIFYFSDLQEPCNHPNLYKGTVVSCHRIISLKRDVEIYFGFYLYGPAADLTTRYSEFQIADHREAAGWAK